MQIQSKIHMDFCSTEKISEQGCVSAALTAFGSDLHLVIGVICILAETSILCKNEN